MNRADYFAAVKANKVAAAKKAADELAAKNAGAETTVETPVVKKLKAPRKKK
jgi:hypothetical protein